MKLNNSTYNSSSYRISTGTRLETSSSYKICRKVVEEILEENPKEENYAQKELSWRNSLKKTLEENSGSKHKGHPPLI